MPDKPLSYQLVEAFALHREAAYAEALAMVREQTEHAMSCTESELIVRDYVDEAERRLGAKP